MGNYKRKYSHSFIYALIDPDTKEIRYIGSSVNPKARFSVHCNNRSNMKHAGRKANWVYGLYEQGKRPLWAILEKVKFEDRVKAEQKYISVYGKVFDLFNIADGSSKYLEEKKKYYNYDPNKYLENFFN